VAEDVYKRNQSRTAGDPEIAFRFHDARTLIVSVEIWRGAEVRPIPTA